MFKITQRILLPLIAFVIFMAGPAAAQAATTWQPSFDKSTHVYVDPKLANDRNYPVRFNGLEQRLVEEGKRNHLEIYVVAVEQGDEALPAGMKWGAFKADAIVGKWSADSSFPKDDYFVIVWVRFKDDPMHGSVAANGGNRMQGYGITGAHLSDPNGPVIPALRQYMPNDPQGAFLQIVSNVNGEIDSQVKAEKDRIEHEKFMAALPWYLGFGGLALALIITLIWLILRFKREKAAALKAIADWRGELDDANKLWMKLNEGYMGFLKDQGDWKTKFKGQTLTRFTAAVTDFAEFTVRQKKANELGDLAQKDVDGCRWPSVTGLRKAQARLSTETVTITGEELSLEEASLFGGTVKKTTYEPPKLLEAMAALFDRTNKALASIVAAFRGAEQNKKDIDGLLPKVETSKVTLTTRSLTFDPYQGRFDEIQRGVQGFVSILKSDPLTAFTGSEEVEHAVEKLIADMARAVSIKDDLGTVETEIGKSATRAKTVRGTVIGYAYPLVDKEVRPSAADTAVFTLAEKDGNPDPIIETARQHLKTALAAVLAGELDKSDSEKTEARNAASRAYKLVDTVLEAKAFVEKNVPGVHTNLSTLKGEIPAATTSVGTLQGDFLPKNITGEPEKLTRANAVIASEADSFAGMKDAYDAQNYLLARRNVEAYAASVQGSRNQLAQVHARLAELQRLRQHARDVVATSQQQSTALSTKLRTNSHTTSAATDAEYKRLNGLLSTQQADVAKKITDWPAAASAADQLTAAYTAVDHAIDQQKREYEAAQQKVAGLSQAISDAAAYVNDGDTRQPAKNKLSQARQALNTVQGNLQVAKSDWAALGREADSSKALANEARSMAQADKSAADSARSAISNAKSKISSVDRSYGHGVMADLSSANSHLRSANSYMGSDNYEQAKSEADSAYRAADSAEDDAQRKVAAIIAEIERQARLAREREEAAERAREAARRASEAASRPSGGGGGGGNYGGGGGGGNHSGGRSGGGDY